MDGNNSSFRWLNQSTWKKEIQSQLGCPINQGNTIHSQLKYYRPDAFLSISCDLSSSKTTGFFGSGHAWSSLHWLVLSPWKVSVVHHCINNRQHGEECVHAYITRYTEVIELYNITHLMTNGTESFLTYHAGSDLPKFFTDAFLLIRHDGSNGQREHWSLLLFRVWDVWTSFYHSPREVVTSVADYYGA